MLRANTAACQQYLQLLQGADETNGQLPQGSHMEAGDNSIHGGSAQQQHGNGEAVRGSNAAAAALGLLQVCNQVVFALLADVGLFEALCCRLVLLRPCCCTDKAACCMSSCVGKHVAVVPLQAKCQVHRLEVVRLPV